MMARDLFEEAGIRSNGEMGRDLFEESGIRIGGGFSQIGKDIGQSLEKTTRDIYDIGRHPLKSISRLINAGGQFYEESKKAGKQIRENPERAFQNMVGGFGAGAEKLYDVPSTIFDYFAKNLKPEWQGKVPTGKEIFGYAQDFAGIERPESPYLPELREDQPMQPGDVQLRGFGEIIPSFVGGGVAKTAALNALMNKQDPLEAFMKATLLEKAIQNAPQIYQGGKKLGKEIYEGAKYTAKESNLAEKLRNKGTRNYDPNLLPILQEAKQSNIPIYPADLYPKSATLKHLTEMAEKTPFINMQAQRTAQNEAAYDAMKSILEKQSKALKYTPFEGIKNIEKVANSESIRAPAAKQLLQKIQGSDSDLNQIIQTSGNVSLFNKKLEADKLLDKVSQLVDPEKKVDVSHTSSAIDDALSKAISEPIPNKGVIKALKQIKQAISKTPRDKKYNLLDLVPDQVEGIWSSNKAANEGIMQFVMEPLKEFPQNFNGIRSTISSLNSIINDYFNGKNALIGEKGVGYLQSIVNALRSDLETFATSQSPELKKAYLDYNKYYKENIVPYKDADVAKAFKNADADKIYGMFIKKTTEGGYEGREAAKRFFNALDKRGKEAVRTKFLENTLKNSYDEERKIFSPAKFATALRKNQGVQEFFTPKEKERLENVRKLMRAIEKSGQMTEPQNGSIILKYILGGAAFATLGIPSYLAKKAMSSEELAKFLAAKGK